MIRRMLVALTVVAAATVPLQPARAELYTITELRGLCRGESAESPEFRTGAGYRLLAQIARERCRMFLLGVADAALELSARRCIPAGTPPAEVADQLAEAVLAEPEGSGGTVAGIVRDALRSRYRCAV